MQSLLNNYENEVGIEGIKKNYISYISDETYNKHRNTLIFKAMLSKKQNLPFDFINEGIASFKNNEELKDQVYWIYSSISQHQKLTPELLKEYKEHLDWDSISRRSDLTPEFITKHMDKLDLSKIRVPMPKEFIDKYFTELGRDSLMYQTLTEEQIIRAIKEEKMNPVFFLQQEIVDQEFIINNYQLMGKEWVSVFNKIKFSKGKDILELLNKIQDYYEYSYAWNRVIESVLDNQKLTKNQRKEVMYLSCLITESEY